MLSLTEADPDFRFLMDGQTVVIDDYLAIRPEARARVDRAIREGKIEVGPWYTLPDEFLTSGETLVRNLQRGLASAAAHGGGLRAGYLPDSFGHAAQMPQLYRQFGFQHAVVWRGVPSAIDRLAFLWESPDGSVILTAYMGSSYSHGVDLPTEPAALAARITVALKALAGFHPGRDVLLMNGNDHVLPQRNLTTAVRGANDHLVDARVRVTSLGDYLGSLTGDDWPRWRGELRSSARANVLMGTLSNRIPDKQTYFDAGQRLERLAEPLAALSGVDVAGLLNETWTLLLQNAAHDTACGSGIDAVAAEARLRSESGGQITDAVVSRCLPGLAGDGQVWNPSAFPRQGLVEVDLDEPTPGAQALTAGPSIQTARFRVPAEEVGRVHAILDERRIAGQRIRAVAVSREGGTVRVAVETRSAGPVHDLAAARLEVERLADQAGVETIEVEIQPGPSHRVLVETPMIAGCSVAPLDSPPRSGPADAPARGAGDTLENGLLNCRVHGDGTLTVKDMSTGLIYRGLNRLVDEGDAGDEYNFSPPAADRERGKARPGTGPTVREGGPLRATLETGFRLYVPAALEPDRSRPIEEDIPLDVHLTVSLERNRSRLDIALKIENRARDHRLRAHFPLPFAVTDSHADTAYHVTRRPVISPRRNPGSPELELSTFPMRSFVDTVGGAGGLTLISRGLHEYEILPGAPVELALTLLRSVGWLSRDDLRYRTGHAGPPMETPGAQVLGAHELCYSLLFHDRDWDQSAAWRAAECALLPLVIGEGQPVSGPAPSIELEPHAIQMTACVPRPGGYDLRLLNASDQAQEAMVSISPAPAEVQRISLGGEIEAALALDGTTLRMPLRRWEIATLRVRRAGTPS